MGKEFNDKRLAQGVKVYLNNFDEYVATEFDKVAQFDGKNIRASRSLEGAIQNYLNNDTTSELN